MKTLIWKEWREHRLFFFLAVGIIILSRTVTNLIPERFLDYEAYRLLMSLLLLPLLFSLFLGATSFTNEFTKNTKQFLFSQPVTASRLFWLKYFSGLALLIILVLLGIGLLIALTPDFSESLTRIPVNQVFLGTIYFFFLFIIVYSAACFSSLLLKNGLPAILCTPFILLFGLLLVIPFVIFLFLISPNVYIFTCLLIPVLIALFLAFGFLVWQKAIAKDASSGKIVLMLSLAVFLISFGFHAIANLRATIRLNRTIYYATAQGVKMTPEEVIPPPVPDKENAAPIYEEAFKLAERLKDRYKEEWEYMPYEGRIKTEELTAEHKRTISRIMRDPEFVNLYDLIEKAVNMPACRFEINYEESLAMLLPHLPKIRMLARLTAARTYILGWEGKHKEAWESAKLGFRLSDSLDDEPILVSKLVCVAVDMFTMDSFQQLLDKPGDIFSFSEYQALIRIIDKKNRRLMRQSLEGELAFFGGHIFRQHASLAQLFVLSFHDGIRNIWLGNIYGSYLGSPILKEDYAFYIHAITNLMQITDEPYYLVEEKHYNWEMELVAHDRFKASKHIVSIMSLSPYGRVHEQQARYNAYLDSFKLALALKIYWKDHGSYPDTLSSLAPGIIPELPLDPFTGKDYIYRRAGKGFIVYSVGPNQKDDGGKSLREKGYDDIAFELMN